MNILKSSLKIIVLLNLLFGLNRKVYSQKIDSNNLISVKIKLIGKSISECAGTSEKYYFTLATITNTRDTSISFWIMSCSWAVRNWLSDNDSIYLKISGCDSNTPEEIKLLPHQSLNFYGLLCTLNNNFDNRFFKLGFKYYQYFKDFPVYANHNVKKKNPIIFWSNEVKLENNLFKYELE